MKKTLLIVALLSSLACSQVANAQCCSRGWGFGLFRARARFVAPQTCAPRPCSNASRYVYAPTTGYACQNGACGLYATEETNAPKACEPTTDAPRRAAATLDSYAPSPCASCGEYEPIKTSTGALVYKTCPTGTCPLQAAAKTATNVAKSVASFLDRANAVRARYGLAALSLDANLEAGSQCQANFCASRGALIHGGGVAEILAQNSAGFDYALSQWLNSPAHRALLLNPNFRIAGAAVYRDSYGRVWCAMRFR